jgi:hypothetical protein
METRRKIADALGVRVSTAFPENWNEVESWRFRNKPHPPWLH